MPFLKYADVPDDPTFEEAVEFVRNLRMGEDIDEAIASEEDRTKYQQLMNVASMAILTSAYIGAGGSEEQQQAALVLIRNILHVLFGVGWREGVWHERNKKVAP